MAAKSVRPVDKTLKRLDKTLKRRRDAQSEDTKAKRAFQDVLRRMKKDGVSLDWIDQVKTAYENRVKTLNEVDKAREELRREYANQIRDLASSIAKTT